jgi:excisionase family DNA binding protein
VHDETIRRSAREGAIPAARLGNRCGFRFRREDLDRFLEARQAEGTDLG